MSGDRPAGEPTPPDQPAPPPEQPTALQGEATAGQPAAPLAQPAAASDGPSGGLASPAAPRAAPPPAPQIPAGPPPPPAYGSPPGHVPPPPPGYAAPPSPAIAALRGQTRSLLARFDPAGVRPTLLVAGIIVAVFFGAQLLNSVLPAAAGEPGPQPQPGGAVDIGPLRVHVPSGWQVTAGPDGPGTRLARGGVAVDFQSNPYQGDAASLYTLFVNQVLAPGATGFQATEPSLIEVGPGMAGARGAYTGVFGGANDGQIEGQLTTFVAGGTGVVIDAWGPIGTLRPLLGDVELIVSTIEVR